MIKNKINLWSFILSISCIPIFLLSVFSSKTLNFFINSLNLHPLSIVLFISLITFFFGVIGFLGATKPTFLLRSIITTIITLVVSILSGYILFIGNLFNAI